MRCWPRWWWAARKFRASRVTIARSPGCARLSAGAFERAAAQMSNGEQRLLRGAPRCARLIDVPRISFESMMRKRARTALAMFSRAETA